MAKYSAFLFLFMAYNSWSQITIYQNDFQGGIPTDMSIVDNDLNEPNEAVSEYNAAWICIEDPENPSDSVAASTSYFTPADTADRWMITPMLVLGSFGNKFSWNAKSQDPSFADDYYILVSTTDVSLNSFTDTIGYIEEENFEWTSRSIDLSAYGYDDQSIYVAFVLRTYDGFKLYIDDILAVKEDDASVSEQDLLSFVIYPVPANDYIKISCNEFLQNIIIRDIRGNMIYEGNSLEIDLTTFASGSYFLTAYSGEEAVTKIFIKR